jgi:dTDP-4-dehydrorhamnose reductase
MHIVITGASGTVGSVLTNLLKAMGHRVTPWRRQEISINNYGKMEHYLRAIEPDALIHLATASSPTGLENESWLVNYDWTSELAWLSHMLGFKFIFTSTVNVFSDDADGPFGIDSEPDAQTGYGNEKRQAESRVFYQNSEATVVRLGWQIGDAPGSNQMVDWILRQISEQGQIEASTKWLPACSFLDDTVVALTTLLERDGGLYMLDSNRGWNFCEIVTALSARFNQEWEIRPVENFVFDQRMIDKNIQLPPLSMRLKALPRLDR